MPQKHAHMFHTEQQLNTGGLSELEAFVTRFKGTPNLP